MQKPTDAITVTLGIFSGLPNPSLQLTGSDAEKLAERARSGFSGKSAHPPPRPRLGSFYGFHVDVAAGLQGRLQLPAEFSVFSGVLSATRDRKLVHWQDSGQLENFLLDEAQRAGHGELLAKAGVQPARGG